MTGSNGPGQIFYWPLQGETMARLAIRFSLRTLFIAMTIFGVCLGKRMAELRERNKALDIIAAKGGTAYAQDGALITAASAMDLSLLGTLWGSRGTTVAEVFLEGPQVRDADLATFTVFDELRTLRLSGTSVSDQGLQNLSKLRNLESLDLNLTDVTDAGIRHLSVLSHLSELHLLHTRITQEGVQRLEMFLPDCNVTWRTGSGKVFRR